MTRTTHLTAPYADMRCRDCCDIGCECPNAYVEVDMHCETCGYEFILSVSGCQATDVPCPECLGSVAESKK